MKTIDTLPLTSDPVISEIRKHKADIAEEFGFSVVALARALQERQTKDKRFPATTNGEQADAGNRRSAGA